MQEIVAFLVVFAAVGYAGWWGWQRIVKSKNPCDECAGCQLKDLKNCQKQKKSCCCAKK